MQVTNSREMLGEIKKYMYTHDISQDELAQKMNKSKQSVSLIFKTANPTLDTLFQIIDALDIQFDYFFTERTTGENILIERKSSVQCK